ncbi:MAG TPA: HepT-like ribonuclease domain-containing protein [Ktedonobacteraceae bacterium]|nr:HepT-like ribonuclease domain-containing protein [Ktedonobacteraceae bacterium]
MKVKLFSTDQGKTLFYQDELVQTWVVRQMEIIGEAARAIPQDFKELHPEIPWRQIVAMRNIIAHIYFDINADRIWAVVVDDLPVLKTQVDAVLRDMSS